MQYNVSITFKAFPRQLKRVRSASLQANSGRVKTKTKVGIFIIIIIFGYTFVFKRNEICLIQLWDGSTYEGGNHWWKCLNAFSFCFRVRVIFKDYQVRNKVGHFLILTAFVFSCLACVCQLKQFCIYLNTTRSIFDPFLATINVCFCYFLV